MQILQDVDFFKSKILHDAKTLGHKLSSLSGQTQFIFLVFLKQKRRKNVKLFNACKILGSNIFFLTDYWRLYCYLYPYPVEHGKPRLEKSCNRPSLILLLVKLERILKISRQRGVSVVTCLLEGAIKEFQSFRIPFLYTQSQGNVHCTSKYIYR